MICVNFYQSIRSLFLVFALILTGCSFSVKETFELGGSPVLLGNTGLWDKKAIQLLVAKPNVLKVLDSKNILIRWKNGSLAYLSGIQWSDSLSNSVQARLIHIFEDTHLLGGVSRIGDGLAVDYQLMTDIRAFGIDYEKSGKQAYVEISVKVLDDRSGLVRNMRVFSARKMVNGSRNDAYVKAMNEAFSLVLAKIVNWTFDNLGD
ncbi:MAG: cholesterol transport system auxiliary component [Candidatus Tokpelaia sp. JSC161]|nr:MAG: cholesterol transport system auxiliary component [Candidatus Tokpelaia sp. JSC161]